MIPGTLSCALGSGGFEPGVQALAHKDAGYFVGGEARPGAHSAADDYLVRFVGGDRLRHPAAHQRSVRFKLTGYLAKGEHLAARFSSSSTSAFVNSLVVNGGNSHLLPLSNRNTLVSRL